MTKYKMFAAIEVGSTQISMTVAEISKNKPISVKDRIKYEISIGSEVYSIGRISIANVEEICLCLEEFTNIMKSYGVEDYICYATTAVREASNSEYIIDQIGIRTGLKVGILSNEEERFLHNKAIALKTEYFDDIIKKGAVFIDVSSGSIQISSYAGGRLDFSANLPLGSVRILEAIGNMQNSAQSVNDVIFKYIKSELDSFKNYYSFGKDYEYLVFFGNQIRNISKMCGGIKDDELKVEDFEKVYSLLTSKSAEDISDMFDIPEEEVKMILPSVLIFKFFVSDKKDKKIIIPKISLTDGICVEYVEKNGYTHTKHIFTDDIISSAYYCAEKYNTDIKHIKRVEEYCEVIFKAVAKKYGLSKHDLLLLRVSAIFSETGLFMSRNDYEKYSYDTVRANPLIGLSKNDMDIIANVVLGDKYKKDNLTKRRRLTVSKLNAILKTARAADSERDGRIESIKASIKDSRLVISIRSFDDIIFEKWCLEGVKDYFEEVFGIGMDIKQIKIR